MYCSVSSSASRLVLRFSRASRTFSRFADRAEIRPGPGDIAVGQKQIADFAGRFDVMVFKRFPLVFGNVQRSRLSQRQPHFVAVLEERRFKQAVVVFLLAERFDQLMNRRRRAGSFLDVL